MTQNALPRSINWQLTYACQLRCTHCYTESGRRASRRLPVDKLLAIADTLVALRPASVQIGGGEPLLVPGLLAVLDRLRAGGVPVHLYTNGLDVDDAIAAELARRGVQVHLSLDGATAPTHDAIRGRPGAFAGALRGLAALQRAAAAPGRRPEDGFAFGVDMTLVRSNFAELPLLCSQIAAAYPGLSFVSAGAAVPSGLAGREGYVERELLTEAQLAEVRDPALLERLRALAPATLQQIEVHDGFFLQLHPEQLRSGQAASNVMEIEPDGGVRGLLIYEGTVGNILTEAPEVLWRRAQERMQDPFVAQALAGARTMKEWAVAARHIDQRFIAPRDLLRLTRRPAYAA